MVEFNNKVKAPVSGKFIQKVLEKSIKIFEIKKVDLSIALVSNKEIKRLNEIYRGENKVTDVLSFNYNVALTFRSDLILPKGKSYRAFRSEINGEIIISYPQAKRQARKLKHSTRKELAVLLIHGLLHLLGYDHKEVKEALKMRKLEEKIKG